MSVSLLFCSPLRSTFLSDDFVKLPISDSPFGGDGFSIEGSVNSVELGSGFKLFIEEVGSVATRLDCTVSITGSTSDFLFVEIGAGSAWS